MIQYRAAYKGGELFSRAGSEKAAEKALAGSAGIAQGGGKVQMRTVTEWRDRDVEDDRKWVQMATIYGDVHEGWLLTNLKGWVGIKCVDETESYVPDTAVSELLAFTPPNPIQIALLRVGITPYRWEA